MIGYRVEVISETQSDLRMLAAKLLAAEAYHVDPSDMRAIRVALAWYEERSERDGNIWYGIFDANNVLAGAARAFYIPRAHYASLTDIAVLAHERGHGLGTRLLGRIAVEATQQGCDTIELYTESPSFFRHLGFEQAPDDLEGGLEIGTSKLLEATKSSST